MSQQRQNTAKGQAYRSLPSGKRWVIMLVLAPLVLVATYLGLVRTFLGQYLENAALLGAKDVADTELTDALDDLQVISILSLVAVGLLFVLIAAIRRSWRVGAAALFVLGAATAVTEVLKRFLLTRPNLADIYPDNAHNSFPSGHTTIAMAILAGLLLAVSYRWRGVAMLLALGWAVSVGQATITARWHRLSDTIGADMVVLTIAAIAVLWLLHSGNLVPTPPKKYVPRTVLVVILVVMALGALGAGALIGGFTVTDWDVVQQVSNFQATGDPAALTAHLDPVFNYNLFLAATSLASGFSLLSALWLWGTLHRIGTQAKR